MFIEISEDVNYRNKNKNNLSEVTHSGLLVSHENSIAGEVVAGTGCVCIVGV